MTEVKADNKVETLTSQRQRKPFVPMTGNPENGDYADWARHVREGEVVPFSTAVPHSQDS